MIGAWFCVRLPFLKTGLLGTANEGLRGSSVSNIMRFGTANAKRSEGRFVLLSANGVRDIPADGDRGSMKLLLETAELDGELCRHTRDVLELSFCPWIATGLVCSFGAMESFFDVECVDPILF